MVPATPNVPVAAFIGTHEDKDYVPHLKGMFNGLNTYVLLDQINMLGQLEMWCNKRGVTRVVCTNTDILSKLLELQGNIDTTPKLDSYQGSLFSYKAIEIVFVNPLKQLFTVSYGKHIAARFISKIAAPESWNKSLPFQWKLLTPSNIEEAYVVLSKAYAIATDIETTKTNLAIRCIGYTAVLVCGDGSINLRSFVLPLSDEFALAWMRKINSLPAPKIFQNGKYDNAYLLRYNAPVQNWLWDTAHLMHSHLSEIPKDLSYIAAYHIREVVYWKDLAETNDLQTYYKYNALDTWATANVWIQQMLELPDWARRNYLLEFPLVYPCLLSEMTGLLRDTEKKIQKRQDLLDEEAKELTSLRNMVGVPINPSSHVQVKKLMCVLGCADLADSSDEKHLKKVMFRHPLNARVAGQIIKVREVKKIRTTYLRTDDDAEYSKLGVKSKGDKDFKSFWLYSLNPQGSDTARLTSGESAFWCGANVQQSPAERMEVKETVRAPDDFYMGECDLEQAESRDLGHISGEENLIRAVTGHRDFHSTNASAFFGKPYESIYDDAGKKTKDKKLRNLSKRTNHGAGYNMGPDVLVDTMGLEAVFEAKKLINLPFYEPAQITEYLLCKFHITYPGIKGLTRLRNDNVREYLKLPKVEYKLFAPGTYYASVAAQISETKMLVSRAYHHTEYNLNNYKCDEYIRTGDWTRYCFGKPNENKLDLNSYVAHCPQSLNSRTLNEAYMRVFYEIALPHSSDFRLNAQIHDSILFCYRRGFEHLASKVKSCMEIPVTVRDVHGTNRTFTVPAALKLGKTKDGVFTPATYWSDTE
jgi:DNA polymerase I-like protein with 3'-5' exonuclease and polymerase domains